MQMASSDKILSASRILVTGAAGFIGWHLCRRLSACNLELHATSRRDRPRLPGEPIWWQADLADPADARRVFTAVNPDIVIHLAGSTGARVDRDLVLPTFHSLATSTANLLVLASEHGCRRVILVGSLNEPVPSGQALIPGSPYAAAKWIASVYGRMFHSHYGTPVVNLRPFMAYGPAQARSKLVPYVTLSLLEDECPRLSSGRVRGDWVYIDDVVDAFLIAAATPGIEGQTFDLGTGSLTSMRTLVETLVEVTGSHIVPRFGAIPDRPHEQEIVADTAPAAEQLGWRAKTSLEEGLRRTVAWYKANPGVDCDSSNSPRQSSGIGDSGTTISSTTKRPSKWRGKSSGLGTDLRGGRRNP
jgi:nucleoside-diphosphate-sugar epimerase